MSFTVYLSGEIHTSWREEIQQGAEALGLDITFTSAVTDHAASDAAGDHLGAQETAFGAIINRPKSMRFALKL